MKVYEKMALTLRNGHRPTKEVASNCEPAVTPSEIRQTISCLRAAGVGIEMAIEQLEKLNTANRETASTGTLEVVSNKQKAV